MSVAILLPDLRGGGAERVCVYLANNFVGRGLKVDMVLMQASGQLLPLLDPRVRVVDLGARRARNVFTPLVRYLRESRPDAVLANMWPMTVIAVAATRFSGANARLILVEHNNWSASIHTHHWLHRIALRWSMRWLMPHADARVGVSDGVARDVERIAGLSLGSVHTVYNPVVSLHPSDLAPPVGINAENWLVGDHKRVIAVGTMKAQKRFDRLIEAFARVSGVDARLLILGEGDERAALEELACRLGVRHRIEMPGFVRDPAPFFRKADLFVLSSDYEGFGNVVVEALEQGTPVVSTDCPSGPSEILEGGKYGALVPVEDVEALANAMKDALTRTHDPDVLRVRAQDFTVDRAAVAYLDLLLPGWPQFLSGIGVKG